MCKEHIVDAVIWWNMAEGVAIARKDMPLVCCATCDVPFIALEMVLNPNILIALGLMILHI